jgi:hypothetical protein
MHATGSDARTRTRALGHAARERHEHDRHTRSHADTNATQPQQPANASVSGNNALLARKRHRTSARGGATRASDWLSRIARAPDAGSAPMASTHGDAVPTSTRTPADRSRIVQQRPIRSARRRRDRDANVAQRSGASRPDRSPSPRALQPVERDETIACCERASARNAFVSTVCPMHSGQVHFRSRYYEGFAHLQPEPASG